MTLFTWLLWSLVPLCINLSSGINICYYWVQYENSYSIQEWRLKLFARGLLVGLVLPHGCGIQMRCASRADSVQPLGLTGLHLTNQSLGPVSMWGHKGKTFTILTTQIPKFIALLTKALHFLLGRDKYIYTIDFANDDWFELFSYVIPSGQSSPVFIKGGENRKGGASSESVAPVYGHNLEKQEDNKLD